MTETAYCFKKLGLAADHVGLEFKALIGKSLQAMGFTIVDYGVAEKSESRVDYPDYASLLAAAVSTQEVEAGIAICGTGLGMAIVANKYPRVRAACIWDEYSCRMSRQHNNANVLCLGGRTLNSFRSVELTHLWLKTAFAGEQHTVRIEKIDKIEKNLLNPIRNR